MLVRVPLDDYADNLASIAQRVASWDGHVLYVTAPTAFEEHRIPDWAESFFGEFYPMAPPQVADIPATHRRYNECVRSITNALPHTAAAIGEQLLNDWLQQR